jgi:hypothetical protein
MRVMINENKIQSQFRFSTEKDIFRPFKQVFALKKRMIIMSLW